MSDHLPPTPPPGNDRVRDTLTALRVDADSCGLSDPASVRQRGQARTRHQALAGVCAAVVVVAVAVTGGSLLGGPSKSASHLPATQTRPIESFLLTAQQMPDPDFWTGFGPWAQLGSADRPVTPLATSCLTAGKPGGLTPAASREFRAGPPTGPHVGLIQTVYTLPRGHKAKAAINDMESSLQACVDDHSSDIGQDSSFTDIPGGRQFNRSFTGVDHAMGLDLIAFGAADGELVVLALEAPGIQDTPPTGGMARALSASLTPRSNAPTTSVHGLAADPMLRGSDVVVAGTQLTFQLSPDPVPEDQRPLQCIPSPTTLGAAEGKSGQLFADVEGTVVEHVLRFADATAAADAVQELAVAFASCTKGDPNEATVDDRGPVRANGEGGVSETLHAARLTTPTADAGLAYYELGIARSSNVVVVLEWSSLGKPFADKRAWVLSDELLDVAAHRATP
jgi:hypothetical protein